MTKGVGNMAATISQNSGTHSSAENTSGWQGGGGGGERYLRGGSTLRLNHSHFLKPTFTKICCPDLTYVNIKMHLFYKITSSSSFLFFFLANNRKI